MLFIINQRLWTYYLLTHKENGRDKYSRKSYLFLENLWSCVYTMIIKDTVNSESKDTFTEALILYCYF